MVCALAIGSVVVVSCVAGYVEERTPTTTAVVKSLTRENKICEKRK